jgi:hypothetical protein|nr:MAG TPA: hypothetical protein [Caudoviricetes sp.]
MLSFADDLNNHFEFELSDGDIVSGDLDLSFDNVISMFRHQQGDELSDRGKLTVSLFLLTGDTCESLAEIDQVNLLMYLVKEYVVRAKPVQEALSQLEKPEDEKQFYSLVEDADYIYAAFMQDYRMDLFDQRGKLHWQKFKALLSGLRDDTKFKQVLQIRMWKPDKNTSAEEKERMEELQRFYALEISQEELEFLAMSEEEKHEYAMKKWQEEQEKSQKG